MAREVRPPDRPQRDWYFFMWNLTEEGIRNPQGVKESIRRASQMVLDLGGDCALYVSHGDPYDLIGIAYGIDDQQAVRLRHAVNALGHFRTTTFLKARDHYLQEFDGLVDETAKLVRP